MSINITKQPLEYNLAVGKNLWTLSGATQSNQLYLSGVVINGSTASILESPKNPSGVAHLDISRILKTKLAPELIETIDTFANATSMILDYRLNYGSKIGLTQSFTTLSDTKYVLNGYKPENIIDWDYIPYIPFSVVYDTCDVLDRIRFSTKFKALTNYPRQSQDIQSNEYHTTTIFNVIQQSDEVAQNDLINIAPSFVKWTFYDENNTILKEHIESINLTTGAGPFDTECTLGTQSTLERILHIPTGTQNLIDASIYPSGLTASLVKRYKVGVWTRDTCISCPAPTTTTTTTTTTSTTTLPPVEFNYYEVEPLGGGETFVISITSQCEIVEGDGFYDEELNQCFLIIGQAVEQEPLYEITCESIINNISENCPNPPTTTTTTTTSTSTTTTTTTSTSTSTTTTTTSTTTAVPINILLSGAMDYDGTTRQEVVYLDRDGNGVDAFNNITPGSNGYTLGTLLFNDDSILSYGISRTLTTGTTWSRSWIKLNSDATQDTSFWTYLNIPYSSVIEDVALQDNKIIIAGAIPVGPGAGSTYTGTQSWGLIRTDLDGTPDIAFYNNLGRGFMNTNRTAVGKVMSIQVQPDNKIICVGEFEWFNQTSGSFVRYGVLRLNSDGTEDTQYAINGGFNTSVNKTKGNCSLLLSNGDCIVGGGDFSLLKIDTNGFVSATFSANVGGGAVWPNRVSEIALTSDNNIIIVGSFSTWNGQTRNRIVKLDLNGVEDTSFYTNIGTGFNGNVNSYTVKIQDDGKILVGGTFTTFNGNSRKGIVRLNPDGTEDVAFYNNIASKMGSTFQVLGFTIKNI